jgi:BMFP domain-containing protein YqiC
MSREAAGTAREKAKEVFGGLDFVSREEFETIKDIAIAAREEVDALKARVAALEGAAAAKTAGISPDGEAG